MKWRIHKPTGLADQCSNKWKVAKVGALLVFALNLRVINLACMLTLLGRI